METEFLPAFTQHPFIPEQCSQTLLDDIFQQQTAVEIAPKGETAFDIPSPSSFSNPDQQQPLTPAPVQNKGAFCYVLVHAVHPFPWYVLLPYLNTLEMVTSLHGSEICPGSPSEFDPFAPVGRAITSPDGNFSFVFLGSFSYCITHTLVTSATYTHPWKTKS